MVGEILRREREKQGLSIADVAGETSIRDVYLEAIEKGDYNPTIRLCIAICKALNRTLDELFWEA